MRPDRFELPLRIVVEGPAAGVALTLQRGASAKAQQVAPASASAEAVTFDLEATVDGALPDGRPRLLGPFVQGPPDGRFVYLTVTRDGAPVGRIKVPLGALDWAAIEAAPPGARLTARIAGRSPKGGPALATVPLLPPGWS